MLYKTKHAVRRNGVSGLYSSTLLKRLLSKPRELRQTFKNKRSRTPRRVRNRSYPSKTIQNCLLHFQKLICILSVKRHDFATMLTECTLKGPVAGVLQFHVEPTSHTYVAVDKTCMKKKQHKPSLLQDQNPANFWKIFFSILYFHSLSISCYDIDSKSTKIQHFFTSTLLFKYKGRSEK